MKKSSQGYVLVALLITVFLISVSIALVASLSLTTYNLAQRDIYKVNAQMTADAALDVALTTLNTVGTSTFSSTYSTEQTLLSSGSLTTTYQTALLDGGNNDRKIVSVIARSKNGSSTVATRRYELDVQRVTSSAPFPISVVSGVGDLILNNNSRITGGDVIVNGRLSMNNQSQIGLSTTPLANAVNVRIANIACPNPPTSAYPEACPPNSGQPITMQTNAVIYGHVQANGQTTNTNMFNPGLMSGSVTPGSFPIFDRTTLTGFTDFSPNHPSLSCANGQTITFPAQKIRITGNYTIGNNCTLIIRDDVWVNGDFSTGNQGRIIVDNSLTRRPLFIIDGPTGFTLANNGIITPNSNNHGIEVRTFRSRASCSPNCINVTGVDLFNSRNDVTINLGNNGNAANSVFIAQWSRVTVSNNGSLGAIAGQSIELSNQAVINFTSSIPGSNNQIDYWTKRGYMRVYQ